MYLSGINTRLQICLNNTSEAKRNVKWDDEGADKTPSSLFIYIFDLFRWMKARKGACYGWKIGLFTIKSGRVKWTWNGYEIDGNDR